MKKKIQAWRYPHSLHSLLSFLDGRKVCSLVPWPAGPRGLSGRFCKQSRVLHGSPPSLSLTMGNHSPNDQHPALTPNTSVPSSRTQEFRMQRCFEHLMQVVHVSRTYDLENWFPLIMLCSIVQEICLTTRGEVKNDVIIMEPLISRVTVPFQVENSNIS